MLSFLKPLGNRASKIVLVLVAIVFILGAFWSIPSIMAFVGSKGGTPDSEAVSAKPASDVQQSDNNQDHGQGSAGVNDSILGEPVSDRPVISAGLWRQEAEGDACVRYLRVLEDGKGKLILNFNTLSSLLVGASNVTIETSWKIDGDEVTFTLLSGSPQFAYERLLATTLTIDTVFHIESLEEDSLTLVRKPDGEVFDWKPVNED